MHVYDTKYECYSGDSACKSKALVFAFEAGIVQYKDEL
jgi:hypothetical protein